MRFFSNLKKPEIQLLVLYVFILFSAYLYIKNQFLHNLFVQSGCFLYKHTGLYCPACGGTRAMTALLKGNITEALGYNLLIILLPLIVYAGYILIDMIIKKKSVNELAINPLLFWLIFFFIAIYGIIRNLPFSVFDYLRP